MDTRKKIIEAILKRADIRKNEVLAETLRWLSDTNLLALAIQLGIDVEAVLA